MNELRVIAIDMTTNQLESLSQKEEIETYTIENKISLLEEEILNLRLELACKKNKIEALKDIISIRNYQYVLHGEEEKEEFDPFAQDIKQQEPIKIKIKEIKK